MKPITIKIAGEAGSGKSTLAHVLKNLMTEHGAIVSINDDDTDKVGVIENNLKDRIKCLNGKEVVIETIQLCREIANV